jgi:hypothetical protein
MQQQLRRRFSQVETLEQRLATEASRLREQAKLLGPGVLRETLLRKARQTEMAAQMTEWLQSPGLRPPTR